MAPKFDQLIKLMMLTTSDNDPEALSALRKANALIASSNMNWEELLKAKVKWPTESQEEALRAAPNVYGFHKTSPEIDAMFEKLDRTVRSNFREFVDDVYTYYQANGGLTARQYQAIRKAYERAK